MIFEQFLDARDAAERAEEARFLRDSAGLDPAARLMAWDRWLRAKLLATFRWPDDAAARRRLIEQCRAEVTKVARQLRGRGWLLDGNELARHVRALLAPIAEAQKAGKIGDFWPYFCAAAARYVGANAEEIQAQARRTGSDMNSALAFRSALALADRMQRRESLTELLAQRSDETLREKLSRRRRAEQRNEAESAQARLL